MGAETLRQITASLNLAPRGPARQEDIAAASHDLGVKFPSDYVEFMLTRNGAEGPTNPGYLVLWPVEEVVPMTRAIREENSPLAERYAFFGGDGGGELYAFDTHSSQPLIVEIPTVFVDPNDVRECGDSLVELVEYLQRTSIVPPEG